MRWQFDQEEIDWEALSELYRIAPLGDKSPAADGIDCSYICDVAVHPGYQGRGLGKAIIDRLREFSATHRKIILYANPGKEGFYRKLGFLPMRTAMAIFRNREHAIRTGLLDEA
jgi:ribosomal protein S18 acetylase RimI-like enzyme